MFKFGKTYTFYMKSGNKIVLDKVISDITIKYNGNEITGISDWKQSRFARNKLFLASIALDQIEAITHE